MPQEVAGILRQLWLSDDTLLFAGTQAGSVGLPSQQETGSSCGGSSACKAHYPPMCSLRADQSPLLVALKIRTCPSVEYGRSGTSYARGIWIEQSNQRHQLVSLNNFKTESLKLKLCFFPFPQGFVFILWTKPSFPVIREERRSHGCASPSTLWTPSEMSQCNQPGTPGLFCSCFLPSEC